MYEHDAAVFGAILADAASRVTAPFFQLPVAGLEDATYRERVYAYELYHQLRLLWPLDLARYSLGGEVDKAGHPLVRGNDLDRTKPDLIAHVPGDMDWNLAVVEIKSARVEQDAVERDLRKLAAFCDPDRGRYTSAYFLVYGVPVFQLESLIALCTATVRKLETFNSLIRLLVQHVPATRPSIRDLCAPAA
jgi:hypothetical protein